MKNFIVYETSTGIILRTGFCPDADLSGQAVEGESVLEGTAANDGTEMIDIEADPVEVIDNPDYVSPVLTNTIEQRLERLENPLPSTLTIIISGIENASTEDDGLVSGVAEDFNGTFVLTQGSPGSTYYSYSSGEKRIDVTMGEGVGSQIYCYLYGAYGSVAAFINVDNPKRGKTFANQNTSTLVNSCGVNGEVFIM